MPTSATNPLPTIYKPYYTTIYTKAATQSDPGGWLTANSPLTIFTVTGAVFARIYGVVGGTALTSTGGLGTVSLGVAGNTQLFLPTTTVSGAASQFAIGNVWVDSTSTQPAELLVAANLTWAIVSATPVILTIATADGTAGAISMYCDWIPVSSGSSVV